MRSGQLHRWRGDLAACKPGSFSKVFSPSRLTPELPQQLHLEKARNRCSSGEDGEPGDRENAVLRGRSRSGRRRIRDPTTRKNLLSWCAWKTAPAGKIQVPKVRCGRKSAEA